MQQTKTRIQIIIKMVNELKLSVVHFARANPMQICSCAWIYPWKKETVKFRAAGPPYLRAVGRGSRAAEPSGSWAAGLLLAKSLIVST